jgi:hypothetical protein
MDILTGSIAGNIHLFSRKPNGTYAAGVTLKQGDTGKPLNVGRGSTAAAADWDGDGDLDLIIGNAEGVVYLAPNEGTRQKPIWGEPQRLKAASGPITAQDGDAAPCVADWDGDGNLDLLLGSGSGSVVWRRNIGAKTKPELAAPVTLVDPFPQGDQKDAADFDKPKRSRRDSKVCVADWNGDGRPDLIVGDYSYERKGDAYKLHGWVWVYLRTPGPGSAHQAMK